MYQLCFVRDNILYFTDNYENQWGDDWDNAPAECNADEPYGRGDGNRKDSGHIRYIGVYDIWLRNDYAEIYSVKEINEHRLPWLKFGCSSDMKTLKAGATMEEAEKFLQDCGAYYGELVMHG